MYYYESYNPDSRQRLERTFEDKYEAIDFARNHVSKYSGYSVKDEDGNIIDSDGATRELLQKLVLKYPAIVRPVYELPAPYFPGGTKNVKAVYLGWNPRNIHAEPLRSIFDRAIEAHEEQLKQVELDWEDVYTQNLCKNYFAEGITTKSVYWAPVAEHWIENLKKELEIFDSHVPVLMSAEVIYWALLNPNQPIRKTAEFYSCTIPVPIEPEHNKINRPLVPMYGGNGTYRLAKWTNYSDRIKEIIHKKNRPIQSKKTFEEDSKLRNNRTTNFKERAIQHLKDFIKERGITFEEYCILFDDDAIKHQFIEWPNLVGEIEKRRKIKDPHGKIKEPFKNMLNSGHIPYNFFVPLMLNITQERVVKFFKGLLNRDDLLTIKKFEIEWAPKPSSKYLDDNTSFDVYIEFVVSDKKNLGLGIEVKFTEKSYPFGETEFLRLQRADDTSPYFKVWSTAGAVFYKENTYKQLGQQDQKQFFRNHLLGISMINCPDTKVKVDEFVSVHLFPSGNTYQSEKGNDYRNTLREDKKQYFKPITFELFIEEARSVFQDDAFKVWLNYLEARYIF